MSTSYCLVRGDVVHHNLQMPEAYGFNYSEVGVSTNIILRSSAIKSHLDGEWTKSADALYESVITTALELEDNDLAIDAIAQRITGQRFISHETLLAINKRHPDALPGIYDRANTTRATQALKKAPRIMFAIIIGGHETGECAGFASAQADRTITEVDNTTSPTTASKKPSSIDPKSSRKTYVPPAAADKKSLRQIGVY